MAEVIQYLPFFTSIIGVTGLIGGAVFFLKYTATKANLDGKDETIETVSKSRDEWRSEAQDGREKIAALAAANETLRDIATQTPEILALTKAVTQLTRTVEKGQKEMTSFLRHKGN